jgi:hypothetical protein
MPTRRLPKGVPSLIRCLTTARDTYTNTPAAERAIGADLYAQLDGAPAAITNKILAAHQDLNIALGNQGPATDLARKGADRAAMFISHFHQVLDLGITRGKFAAGARSYYGRDIHARSLPPLGTYQEIHEAGQSVATGETARQTAEVANYTAMELPAATDVAAAVNDFNDFRAAAAAAQADTNAKQEALQALYEQALPLATDIYDTVEFFYRKDPDPSSRREKCARWGVVYVYGAGETPPVPEPAEISNITTPGPGQVHFHYDAVNASTFDVLHKAPTETEFTKVADDVEAKVYQASGLAVGAHEYKVIGRNVTGDGPASEIAIVQVN